VVIEAAAAGAPRHVVVLANRLPYPIDDGWKTRTYHVVRGLARRARVTLLVFDDSSRTLLDEFRTSVGGSLEIVQVPAPSANSPLRLLLGLITATPLYVWNMRSRRYARALREVLGGKPDVVVAELAGMYAHLLDLPRGATRVIDTHNVDSILVRRYATAAANPLRRIYARMTVRKLERLERRIYDDADHVWVCSEGEIDTVRGIAPAANVTCVPNGVDTSRLAPQPGAPSTTDLLFFGRMDYQPNRDALDYFAAEILPRLRERLDVTVNIVGAGIDARMEELARANPELRMVGRVDDIRAAIASAAIVIVPLRMGGGTRLKILEALAMGKAIVSTSIGAEGLDVESGRDIVLADSAAEFAAAVERLLLDPAERAELGARGRETAAGRYDWRRIEDVMGAQLGWPDRAAARSAGRGL
jgi:polysaccharide biosynthesis protein PslH